MNTDPSTGRPREAHGGGPPEEPEGTASEFGDLLIGAKFWFKGNHYLKISVDKGRLLDKYLTTLYVPFAGRDKVEDVQ